MNGYCATFRGAILHLREHLKHCCSQPINHQISSAELHWVELELDFRMHLIEILIRLTVCKFSFSCSLKAMLSAHYRPFWLWIERVAIPIIFYGSGNSQMKCRMTAGSVPCDGVMIDASLHLVSFNWNQKKIKDYDTNLKKS
ncbi:unnamed protein product [Caenorhabditis brenneri]